MSRPRRYAAAIGSGGHSGSATRKPGYSIEHQSWFIPLTQGVIALVDADMVPILAQHNWCAIACRKMWKAGRWGRGTARIYMHRVVMSAPAGMEVDHRHHFVTEARVIDNRRANLRVCTRQQNQANQRPQTSRVSKFKGVSRYKQTCKWRARISISGTPQHLGMFDSEIAAARAYDAAALKYFGEFAHVNGV